MKIGIDATLVRKENTGSGFYIINLIDAVFRLDSSNVYYIFTNKNNFELFIKKKQPNLIIIDKKFIGRLSRVLWEFFILPFEIKKRKIDILHSPNYITPLFKLGFKTIATIHDLTVYLFPDKYTIVKRLFYKFTMPIFVKLSDLIIAVSDNTKKDILKILRANEKKVKITFESYPEYYNNDKDRVLSEKVLQKYGILKEFILFVGMIEPRKNILSILKGFINLDKEINADLVIVGKKGWYFQEIDDYLKKIDLEKLKNKIIFTGFVCEGEVIYFYQSALIFIYPSVYEGFGLPLLLAMACGTPVITSNLSSLPEVVGDAAIKINPENIYELEENIKFLYNNPLKRKGLIDKGLQQCKKFNPNNFGRNIIKVYEECMDYIK